MSEVEQLNKNGEEDLAILMPQRTETIGGHAIVMRELTFTEGLQHGVEINAIVEAVKVVAVTGVMRDLDALRGAFAQVFDPIQTIIAIACDQPLEWVRSLSAQDGEDLLTLWWGVNGPLFLKRVLLSVQLEILHKARSRAGQTSSKSSSSQAIAPNGSRITPGGN